MRFYIVARGKDLVTDLGGGGELFWFKVKAFEELIPCTAFR